MFFPIFVSSFFYLILDSIPFFPPFFLFFSFFSFSFFSFFFSFLDTEYNPTSTPPEPTREVLKVGDLAVKKSWSDQNLSEFSKVNLIGQI